MLLLFFSLMMIVCVRLNTQISQLFAHSFIDLTLQNSPTGASIWPPFLLSLSRACFFSPAKLEVTRSSQTGRKFSPAELCPTEQKPPASSLHAPLEWAPPPSSSEPVPHTCTIWRKITAKTWPKDFWAASGRVALARGASLAELARQSWPKSDYVWRKQRRKRQRGRRASGGQLVHCARLPGTVCGALRFALQRTQSSACSLQHSAQCAADSVLQTACTGA